MQTQSTLPSETSRSRRQAWRRFGALSGGSYLWQISLSLTIGLVLGAVIIQLAGENPLAVYSSLLKEAYFSPLGIMIGIQRGTPYLFAAVGAVVAFQGGAINMGLDGQFMVGVAVAGLSAVLLPEWLPGPLRIVLIFLLCGLGGMAAALIPAAFKHFSGVSEVITGMIANLLMPHLLSSIIFAIPILRMARGAASNQVPEGTWLAQFHALPLGGLGTGTKANVAILIGIALVVGLTLWWRHSRLGYEIRITRHNPAFAEFGGIRAGRMFFISMMLSGAIAGMAGATEVLGVWHKLSYGTLAVGNKGLVLALVGGTTYAGSALAAMIYGGLEAGAMNASWSTSIPRPLIDILVQMLFLLAAVPSMRRFFTGANGSDGENLGGRYLTSRGR